MLNATMPLKAKVSFPVFVWQTVDELRAAKNILPSIPDPFQNCAVNDQHHPSGDLRDDGHFADCRKATR